MTDTDRLLDDLLAPDVHPADLCRWHKLSPDQLVALLESPECQARLAALARIAELRAQALAPIARAAALARLTDLVTAGPALSASPETLRKAATTLARLTTPPARPSAAPDPHQPPPRGTKPHARPHPRPEHLPEPRPDPRPTHRPTHPARRCTPPSPLAVAPSPARATTPRDDARGAAVVGHQESRQPALTLRVAAAVSAPARVAPAPPPARAPP